MSGRWTAILGITVTIVIVVLALTSVDLPKVGEALQRADWRLIPLMIVLSVAGLVTRAVRWQILVRRRLALAPAFHISNVGYMFNNLLPLRAGEAARVLLAANAAPPIPVMTTISTIVLERVLDLIIVLALLGVALASVPAAGMVTVGGTALTAAVLIGAIVLFLSAHRRDLSHGLLRRAEVLFPALRRLPIGVHLDKFLDGLAALTTPGTLVLLVFWTVASWVLSVAASMILLLAFFGSAELSVVLLFMVFSSLTVSVSSAVAYTPAGVGPYHASVIVALTLTGFTEPEGAPLAFAIVLHGVHLAIYVVLGMIGLTQQQVSLPDMIARVRRFVRGRSTEEAADGALSR